MKSLICRITCNEIPNLSYYLQCNTQSYLQYDTLLYRRIICNTYLSYLSMMADLQGVQNVRFRWNVHPMFIQDYAWECLGKLESSFKTMLENVLGK